METLGKYGPLEKLSDVPMGAVYKAFDGSRMRYVTLRTLGSDIEWDPALKKRFCDECRVLIGQRHPNLAAVYEQGQEQNIAYVVTELLPGRNLKMLIAEKAAMTVEQKFAIMIQAAAGLCHAHSLGVLHRNLQPHSIEILPDGRAKIADFGVGGLLSSPGAPVSAQSESRIYLAPEQLLGKEATCQSDVFSLGLIFYEFLTGTHPFYDSDSSKTLDNILYKTHFPTVEQFPEVPFALWPIVERCLAKDAEERYAGMLDFSTACQAALDELAEDSQWMRIELQTTLPRLQKAARKHAAPPALAKLQSEVEHALFNEDKSDYQSLSRLVAALAEQHRLLETSSEATFPSLPEPADTPPGKDSITVDEGTMSAEASAGVPDSKETCTPAPCTPGLPLQSGAADFPAMMDSGFAPFAAAAGSREKSEAETTEPPAPARDENLSLPGLPLPLCGPAPAESFVARHPSGELPRMGGTRKESVSELLRKIDQGQDSTRKTVEKFLAGRQAMATTGTQKSPETALAGTASAGAQREACEPKREATPAAVTPGTDREQPQQPAAHARTGKDHASRARLPIEGVEGVPRGFSRQDLRRATLWISAAVLVLILAVAVPTWVRNRFGSNAGRNIFALGQRATGMVPSRTSGKSSDRTVDALRSRLDFTRQDILLQEAQILRSIGRLGESKVFLKRLIEIYPTYLPAQQELDQIEAATSPPKNSSSRDQDNQQQTVQKLLASAASAINTGKLPRAMSDLDKADQMQPGLVEVANLRRRLEAKKAELAASTTRQQEEQLAAQRQNESEALIRRTDELYRQGKYDEALAAVEERLAQVPSYPGHRNSGARLSRCNAVSKRTRAPSKGVSMLKRGRHSTDWNASIPQIPICPPFESGRKRPRPRAVLP